MTINLDKCDYIGIITICTVIYLLYEKLCNKNNIEKMTDTGDITTQIREEINIIYKADIQAIRNLADVSKKLQEKGVTLPGNLTVEGKFNYLPTGSIIAFNGITAPKGWAVCDGTKGTPDLRGRFIRMWNDTGFKQTDAWHGGATQYTVKCKRISNNKETLSGNKRGSDKGYIFKHSFGDMAGTDVTILDKKEMPAHNHTMSDSGTHVHKHYYESIGGKNCDQDNERKCNGGGHWRNTNAGGNHKHTIANTGSGSGHGISNPYHVLTYIMKL